MAKSRIIQIFGEIDSKLTEKVLDELRMLNEKSNEPIEVRITSGGGDVIFGLTIFDAIRLSKAPVKTTVYGEACSIAAVILQAGIERRATAQSRILIHQVFGYSEGSPKELRNDLKEAQRLQKQIFQLLAEKTGKTIKQIASGCRRASMMSAQEALRYGLIDGII